MCIYIYIIIYIPGSGIELTSSDNNDNNDDTVRIVNNNIYDISS